MSKQIDISFVVPVRDSASSLITCLKSIVGQEDATYEVLAIDDAGTDDIRETLAKEFPIVTLFRMNSRKGPSFAKNVGAALSRADIIWFMDSDAELLDRQAARHALDYFKENSRVAALGGEFCRWGTNGYLVLKKPLPNGDARSLCVENLANPTFTYYLSTANCAVRRDLFVAWGGFDPDYFNRCEDVELCDALGRQGYRIAVHPSCCAIHRRTVREDSSIAGDLLFQNQYARMRFVARNRSKVRLYALPILDLFSYAFLFLSGERDRHPLGWQLYFGNRSVVGSMYAFLRIWRKAFAEILGQRNRLVRRVRGEFLNEIRVDLENLGDIVQPGGIPFSPAD